MDVRSSLDSAQALYDAGDYGAALPLFEEAGQAFPWDAEHNLEWVGIRLSDAVVEPTNGLFQWLGTTFRTVAASESWLMILVLALAITAGLLAARRWWKPSLNWRWPFTTTIISLVLAGVYWISLPASDAVVVTAKNSYGYSEPSSSSKRILLLSEGSAARLRKSSEGWFFLELGDGRLAWFEAAQWGRVLPPESTLP